MPAGSDQNTLTVTDISWPSGAFDGYCVFGAMDYPELLTDQGSPDGTLPASITLTTALNRSVWTFPSPVLPLHAGEGQAGCA